MKDNPAKDLTEEIICPNNKKEINNLDSASSKPESLESPLPRINIIGFPITALALVNQIEVMIEWANLRQSRFVCVANVHMLMEAYWHQKLASVLNTADLVTPDGMPLVWMMKLMGVPQQNRVAGMDILLALCELASQQNISVLFLGSQQTILEKMRARLKKDFPNLAITGMEPLPFRDLTSEEDKNIIEKINRSQAQLVLVSLGCPKQEYWMHAHKNKIQAVMVGLGGVFPVYAGIHKRPPTWISNSGLEWLYRLIQEPRRLWRRYLHTIPPFIYLALKQLLENKVKSRFNN